MVVRLKFLSEKTKHICFKNLIILDIWNSDHKARLIAKIKRREVELDSILTSRFLVSPVQAASSTGVLRIPAGLLKGLYFFKRIELLYLSKLNAIIWLKSVFTNGLLTISIINIPQNIYKSRPTSLKEAKTRIAKMSFSRICSK